MCEKKGRVEVERKWWKETGRWDKEERQSETGHLDGDPVHLLVLVSDLSIHVQGHVPVWWPW